MKESIILDVHPRYDGIKKELEEFVDEDLYQQLVISLSVLKTMDETCVIYSYHRALCDYWFSPVAPIDES